MIWISLIMKRNALIKHLDKNGAELLREGGSHSIDERKGLTTAVPRHREIVDKLVRRICKDLEIPFVR
jgi:mRNA interferase HicA